MNTPRVRWPVIACFVTNDARCPHHTNYEPPDVRTYGLRNRMNHVDLDFIMIDTTTAASPRRITPPPRCRRPRVEVPRCARHNPVHHRPHSQPNPTDPTVPLPIPTSCQAQLPPPPPLWVLDPHSCTTFSMHVADTRVSDNPLPCRRPVVMTCQEQQGGFATTRSTAI